MSAGYTKGPWVGGPAATVLGADGRRICQLAVRIDEQEIADGRLIVAAPELLNALEAFVECARYDPTMCGKSAFKGWSQSDLRRAETRARAAIAKAKGGAV